MIKELSILGLRGFGKKQKIEFALPIGTDGSGLTIMTGPNNSGKTTIIEAIKAFNGKEAPSFSEGKRNAQYNGTISIELIDNNNESSTISSSKIYASSTERIGNADSHYYYYVVPSRRSTPFEFNKTPWNKNTYIDRAHSFIGTREANLRNFEARIFQIGNDKPKFDKILKEILGNDFEWTIDQRDNGQYYIKYINDNISHSMEGIGDGIWSVFTICAALYDINDNDTVIIDEPELSIHPAIQKKIMKLLIEYSKKYQIIISTHSPYFIDWGAINNGAKLLHIVKENKNTKCYWLSPETIESLKCICKDINNPHILGTESKEIFFLEDKIILVEGQEDVVIFDKIQKEVKMCFNGTFFGWGVGGAEKMKTFLSLFNDLGYKHVVAILDGDKKEEAEKLIEKFNNYKIIILPTDDIRDKEERCIKSKNGITFKNGELKPKYSENIKKIIEEINSFMN